MKNKKGSSGSSGSISYEPNYFNTCGNFILPKHQFCKCGIYKDNGLISSNGGMITWKI